MAVRRRLGAKRECHLDWSTGATRSSRSTNAQPACPAELTLTYTARANGDVHVGYEFVPAADSLAALSKIPRVGLSLRLPFAYRTMDWFGRGPQENYQDRWTSAAVGWWHGTVDNQFERYSRPQETGNKTGVRWIALRDRDGYGIMAIGDEALSVSAWPFMQEDLDFRSSGSSASGLTEVSDYHGADIPLRDFITLNLDCKQMGVGGDTSWGRQVHEQYQLAPGNVPLRIRPAGGDTGGWLGARPRAPPLREMRPEGRDSRSPVCRGAARPRGRAAPVAYASVLDRHGAPAAMRDTGPAGHQRFSPMFDLGSWHGYLLPADSAELRRVPRADDRRRGVRGVSRERAGAAHARGRGWPRARLVALGDDDLVGPRRAPPTLRLPRRGRLAVAADGVGAHAR